jgi:hypothetical protein
MIPPRITEEEDVHVHLRESRAARDAMGTRSDLDQVVDAVVVLMVWRKSGRLRLWTRSPRAPHIERLRTAHPLMKHDIPSPLALLEDLSVGSGSERQTKTHGHGHAHTQLDILVPRARSVSRRRGVVRPFPYGRDGRDRRVGAKVGHGGRGEPERSEVLIPKQSQLATTSTGRIEWYSSTHCPLDSPE